MKNALNNLQLIFTAIGGYLGYFLGGLDGFIYALVTFVVIDYLTGIMAAIVERKLSSEIGFRGIFKKVLIFLLVTVGNIIDKNLVGTGGAVRTAVIFFYISNEGISIIENAIRIGLPVPEKLKNVLEQLQNKEDET
mgnify:FL=1|jgi:toxin secretion/phage lysis holin